MSKFGSWYEWKAMARDLKRGLSQLTFADNMPGEPVKRTWIPDIKSSMAITTRDFSGEYFVIGDRCFWSIYGTATISASATEACDFFLSLPFPRDLTEFLGLEFAHAEINDGVAYSRAIAVYGDTLLNSSQWVRVAHMDGSGKYYNWYKGKTISVSLFGSYRINGAYRNAETDIPAPSPITNAWSDTQWLTWNPTIAVSGSVISNLVVHFARYYRSGDTVSLQVYFDFTLSGTPTANEVTVTLPFPVANQGCAFSGWMAAPGALGAGVVRSYEGIGDSKAHCQHHTSLMFIAGNYGLSIQGTYECTHA